MRKLRLFSLLLVVSAAAFTLTSCLGDSDDNNKLTPQQTQQCFRAVQGSHHGKLIYIVSNSSSGAPAKKDSVSTSWTITSDSTMTLIRIPAKVIATAVDTTTAEHKEIRDAILKQPDQSMECYIGFVKMNPIQWLINPTGLTYEVAVKGGNHKIQVVFYMNNTYSFGQFTTSTNSMLLQIIAAGAKIDGSIDKSSTPLVRSTPFYFVNK